MPAPPDRIEDLERLVGDSPGSLLVAEESGAIVGTLIAGWDGWAATCIGSPSGATVAGAALPRP